MTGLSWSGFWNIRKERDIWNLHKKLDSMSMAIWYVEKYHNNQKYYKGHNGYTMFLGKGAVVSPSRQKIGVRIATEIELVKEDDSVPILL